MDEHIEKPSIFNHEKEDAMISSRNTTPKVMRQDRPFSSEPKDQSVSDPKSNSYCESSDEGVQNRFGVETSRVVLDENDNWQNGKVILQNPLVANDFDRLNKKWNCQIQGHLIPQYMSQILHEHRKLHTTEVQRTFRLT